MSRDPRDPAASEPVPPELESLHYRLLADGAVWREGLPPTERLEARLAAARGQQSAALPIHPHNQPQEGAAVMAPTKGGTSVFRGRIKTVTAVMTIAAVVALFALLVRGFAVGRSSPTGHPTLSSSPSSGQWVAGTKSKNLPGLPVVAASNPQVIYLVAPASGAGSKLVLQRSDDGGASWRSFALPVSTPSALIAPFVTVSPLDALRIFLTVTGDNTAGTNGFPACASAQAEGGFGPLVALSGRGPCVAEYVSNDGGAHWQPLALPDAGPYIPQALGSPTTYTVRLVDQNLNVLRAQGQRLYSAMGQVFNVQTGTGLGGSGIRLITSTDGGLTWSFADGALAANVQSICDYAPAPEGAALFAIASQSCNGEVAAPLFLWRSDDAGAHWQKVGQLPGNSDLGLIAVAGAGANGGPALYLDATTLACAGGCSGTFSPADVRVSLDGGKTWQAAPSQGFPGAQQSPGGLLGVLSDGSVLFLDTDPNSQVSSFRAWKSGDTSWHQVGNAIAQPVVSALLTPPTAGKQTLVVVTKDGPGSYSVQGFQL